MKCPACSGDLQNIVLSSIEVIACVDGCGGIWFDARELQKVDEAFEPEGEAIAELPPLANPILPRPLRILCPCCDDTAMLRRFTSLLREVEVDECPGCGGFWLDGGELAHLREENRKPGAQEKLKSAATMGGAVIDAQASSEANSARWRVVGEVCRVLRFDAR